MFRIGEVAASCGVDRQTILFYERRGLIHPTAQNSVSGYRYYSTDAVVELMQILQLRDAGMSIAEIGDFITNGASAADRVIAGMEKKLAALIEGIDLIRILAVKEGEYKITYKSMPETLCFVREYKCHGIEDSIDKLFGAFNDVLLRKIKVRNAYGIYAEYPGEVCGDVNLTDFDMKVFIPVADGTCCGECVNVPATRGISLCHKGDYQNLGAAYSALWEYVKANGMEPDGAVREYYVDGDRGAQTDYLHITRLYLPIKDMRKQYA